MNLAIDIILVAVMVLTVIGAWRRGFVGTLFKLFTVVASAIVAVMFHKELGVYLDTNFIHTPLKEFLVDFASRNFAEGVSSISLPEGFLTVCETVGLDVEEVLSGLSGAPAQFAGEMAVSISAAISNVIAFAAIFLVAVLVLNIVSAVLDIVAKLPVIRSINKLLGLLLGVVEALVFAVVLANLAVAICSVYGSMQGDMSVVNAVENTVVAKAILSYFPKLF